LLAEIMGISLYAEHRSVRQSWIVGSISPVQKESLRIDSGNSSCVEQYLSLSKRPTA